MDNWWKLVTLSIIGLVFRQLNISVPDEASSLSSSTSSSSTSPSSTSSSTSSPSSTSSSSSSPSSTSSSSSSPSSTSSSSSSSSSTSLPSSSSFSFSKGSLYDVFISFRGEDTHKSFTSHLYKALTNAGVNAFIDDEELKRGENITTDLVRAIQGSKISLIVFSSGYADSSWCLEELVHIMECRTTLGQIVIPIFYYVDPLDVRKQTGRVAQSLLKHRDTKKVARWRAALTQAADLSGFDLKNSSKGDPLISSFMNSGFNVPLFTFGLQLP